MKQVEQCVEIIEDGITAGHKILLFSSYTSMFPIIEEELKKRNISYFKLTGSTKVDERIELVEEFNQNEDIKVFLISLKAGGTGLNLIGADMVIHYDPWWNISAENQATDRAYRIGQKNNVQVYKLITKDSIEEKIYELQQKKAELTDNILNTEAKATAVRAAGAAGVGDAEAADKAEVAGGGHTRRALPPPIRRTCAVREVFNTARVIGENRVGFTFVLVDVGRRSQAVLNRREQKELHALRLDSRRLLAGRGLFVDRLNERTQVLGESRENCVFQP